MNHKYYDISKDFFCFLPTIKYFSLTLCQIVRIGSHNAQKSYQSTYILRSVIDALFLTIRNLGNSELLSTTMSEVVLTGMVSHPRSVQRTSALIAHFSGVYHTTQVSFCSFTAILIRGVRITNELIWAPTFFVCMKKL